MGGARFEGKVAVVTGGGYGIGEAIVREFAAEGAAVVIAARSRERIESLAKAIVESGGKAIAVVTDVANEESVEHMVKRTLEAFGQLDILVNNAGIAGPTKIAPEITSAEWHETIEVNLTGAFYCAKHAAATMIERGRGGAIVNISSIAGRIGYPMRTPYAASKWGMIGLNHSLAAELGAHRIRVNCVCPGGVQGDRIDAVIKARAEAAGVPEEAVRKSLSSGVPLGRMVTAQEVARSVLFFADEKDSSGVTGQAFTVCAGYRMQ
jgi:NAD(P)-dependent dehydrogenase (short-subunit alcohol dehydrogenase family)